MIEENSHQDTKAQRVLPWGAASLRSTDNQERIFSNKKNLVSWRP
jgi:hypothetical protein